MLQPPPSRRQWTPSMPSTAASAANAAAPCRATRMRTNPLVRHPPCRPCLVCRRYTARQTSSLVKYRMASMAPSAPPSTCREAPSQRSPSANRPATKPTGSPLWAWWSFWTRPTASSETSMGKSSRLSSTCASTLPPALRTSRPTLLLRATRWQACSSRITLWTQRLSRHCVGTGANPSWRMARALCRQAASPPTTTSGCRRWECRTIITS
mmetsp:Transcript_36427/g.90840  ORF Transcript_36427/g.90840 Transcript_36427/m.90840 type:complete len:211 (-) Transcript_36427:349-981(-)